MMLFKDLFKILPIISFTHNLCSVLFYQKKF